MLEYNEYGFVDLGRLETTEQDVVSKRLSSLTAAGKGQNTVRISPRFYGLRTGLVARYLVLRALGLPHRFAFEQYGTYVENRVSFHVVSGTSKSTGRPTDESLIYKPVSDLQRMAFRPQFFIFVYFSGKGPVWDKDAHLVGYLPFSELQEQPSERYWTTTETEHGDLVRGNLEVVYRVDLAALRPGVPDGLLPSTP